MCLSLLTTWEEREEKESQLSYGTKSATFNPPKHPLSSSTTITPTMISRQIPMLPTSMTRQLGPLPTHALTSTKLDTISSQMSVSPSLQCPPVQKSVSSTQSQSLPVQKSKSSTQPQQPLHQSQSQSLQSPPVQKSGSSTQTQQPLHQSQRQKIVSPTQKSVSLTQTVSPSRKSVSQKVAVKPWLKNQKSRLSDMVWQKIPESIIQEAELTCKQQLENDIFKSKIRENWEICSIDHDGACMSQVFLLGSWAQRFKKFNSEPNVLNL